MKLAQRIRGRRRSVTVRRYANSPLKVVTTSNKYVRKKDKRGDHTEYNEILPITKSTFRYANKALFEIAKIYNVRAISPRNMANLSFDLYLAGYINRKLYLDLSYQVDFSPRYNQTIGALIGENAAPDKQRDYIRLWHKRLLFEQNYFGYDLRTRHHGKRILSILSILEEIAELLNRVSKTKFNKYHTTISNLPALSLKRNDY